MSNIPDFQTLMRPLLAAIANGARNANEAKPILQKQFDLGAIDLEEMLPSGRQTVFGNRIGWARTYLFKAGLIEKSKRNDYNISAAGRLALNTYPNEIRVAELEAFAPFREWKVLSGAKSTIAEITEEPSNTTTPEERISIDFKSIEDALVEDLLTAVLAIDPSKFEQLIVDLLLAMGYGGGDRSMGERIGKSGDGGIDGIINEDALGLDAVYIQAKRYAPENKIGRPALQAFVGSLTGEGANKGVFVTTSDFSKEAKDYLNKVQHRIVLINGDRLARLMIQHEVGVRARKTYVLRSVDEDYFTDF